MDRNRRIILVLCVAIGLWIMLFPATQAASSSPMLGFTLTPTKAISTSVSLTETPTKRVATLPPPAVTQTGVLIPVTGANQSAAASGGLLVLAGVVVVASGIVALGLSRRKK